jgi:hypothetical protein
MMRNKTEKKCRYCEALLERNAVGLNKKLFEGDTKRNLYMCLPCMAEYLECTEEDLREKMEEFKREGCKLFS